MAVHAIPMTERRNAETGAIDAMAEADAIAAMIDAHVAAAQLVRSRASEIEAAASILAETLRDGGRVYYCGAGSSGLMALADALELPGTFGIDRARIRILLAEGIDTIKDFEAAAEDSAESADAAISREAIGKNDCFVLLSASGSTPYVVEMARAAARAGAKTVAVANNRGSDLGKVCDLAIEIETAPELVAGSTRMGAATAQKIVLNSISTVVGIRLGHVFQGHMVNLNAANTKLRKRAQRIVGSVVGLPDEVAAELIDRADGSVKAAILMGRGVNNKKQAEELLAGVNGHLGRALESLDGNQTSTA